MTLLSAIERSERLVKSMEARGYDGDVTPYGEIPRPPIHERLLVLMAYVAVVAYVVVGSFGVSL